MTIFFQAMASGLLSDTYLEAHRIVLVSKSEDEEETQNEEITEEELRQVQEDNFYDKLASLKFYKPLQRLLTCLANLEFLGRDLRF